ncbi:DUF1707 SHOCT-like domain-containing protein [Actinoplanes solisilvae]|uniref:DUF1707 SHOCT-like domain-containing protein n=1 Tax=Actinoplanes solisilvae TaxID=2486853 RepID=UPI001F0BF8F8|nr:DUF1707 domain-containing protein [Actinoplanes solisilvae]
MSRDPQEQSFGGVRAGDADRKAVADQLKTALDEGRLDLHEYDERLQRAYAAKTYADLDGLLDDLPGTIPVQRSQVQPATAPPPPTAAAGSDPRRANDMQWVGPYAGVVLVCTLIWLVTSIASGELLYFWPVWMLIPLILGFFGRRFGRGR